MNMWLDSSFRWDDGVLVSLSADIRVLELERKGAMSAAEAMTEEKTGEADPAISDLGGDSGARSSLSQKRSREKQQQDVQNGSSESRCIFTPVKKARKYEQPPGAVRRLRGAHADRPPSSIASGVNMLFFK